LKDIITTGPIIKRIQIWYTKSTSCLGSQLEIIYQIENGYSLKGKTSISSMLPFFLAKPNPYAPNSEICDALQGAGHINPERLLACCCFHFNRKSDPESNAIRSQSAMMMIPLSDSGIRWVAHKSRGTCACDGATNKAMVTWLRVPVYKAWHPGREFHRVSRHFYLIRRNAKDAQLAPKCL